MSPAESAVAHHAQPVRRRRGRTLFSVAILGLLVLGACTTAGTVTVEQARADLVALIGDVTAADAYRYKLIDNTGAHIGPLDLVWVDEAATFAGVYFTYSELDGQFHLQLATSDDLLNWTWHTTLADLASQPSIAAADGGGYVVAWEQEPDPIHMVIAYFATWDDLLAGNPERRFDVPITTPACGEGTPSIEAASKTRVDIGFHYHAGCVRDRQAGGSTDWTSWSSAPRPAIDTALDQLGASSHIGDRDTITFEGHDLMLVEGQLVPDNWSSWRMFLYDDATQTAEPLVFTTHAGSRSYANPTISEVEINGRTALVVTLFLFTEGAAGGEDEELLFYRYR